MSLNISKPLLIIALVFSFFTTQVHADLGNFSDYDIWPICVEDNNWCMAPQPCTKDNNYCQKFKRAGFDHYGCGYCPGYDVMYCASSPQIRGTARFSDTHAPIPYAWIEYTDKNGHKRYSRTDANGRYSFLAWFNCLSNAQIDKMKDTRIDANEDGVINDADPILYDNKSLFHCGTAPGTIRVFPSKRFSDGSCSSITLSFPNISGIIDLDNTVTGACLPGQAKETECIKEYLEPQYIECSVQRPTSTPTPTVPPKKVSITNAEINSDLWPQFTCLQTELCTGENCISGQTRKVSINGVSELKRKLNISESEPVYIVECVKKSASSDINQRSSYDCTTGSTNGNSLLGLSSKSNYSQRLFTKDGAEITDKKILIAQDTYTWQSTIPPGSSSIFLLGASSGSFASPAVGTNFNTQQQATLSNETGCQMVQDPYGIVTDSHGTPLEGVKISLLKLQSSGTYRLLNQSDVSDSFEIGKLINPTYTNSDGAYMFHIHNGKYRIIVSKAGYKEEYKDIEENGTPIEVNFKLVELSTYEKILKRLF